jgi:hypothetical protein
MVSCWTTQLRFPADFRFRSYDFNLVAFWLAAVALCGANRAFGVVEIGFENLEIKLLCKCGSKHFTVELAGHPCET